MKKLIMSISLTFFCIQAFSQENTSKDGSTVIFLGKDRTKTNMIYNSSAIKLGILDMVSGLFGLHYEHELSSIFSLQAGGGLTSRNYTQGLLSSDEATDESNNNVNGGSDILDSYYNYDTRAAKIGYFISFEPKFFPNEDGFDGTFVSFLFSYRRYNYKAKNIENTFSDPINEFENQIITAIGIGHQFTNTKTIIEYDFSFGIRNINGERRDLWYVPDLNGGLVETALINNDKSSQLFISLSLKMGLYWNAKNNKIK